MQTTEVQPSSEELWADYERLRDEEKRAYLAWRGARNRSRAADRREHEAWSAYNAAGSRRNQAFLRWKDAVGVPSDT